MPLGHRAAAPQASARAALGARRRWPDRRRPRRAGGRRTRSPPGRARPPKASPRGTEPSSGSQETEPTEHDPVEHHHDDHPEHAARGRHLDHHDPHHATPAPKPAAPEAPHVVVQRKQKGSGGAKQSGAAKNNKAKSKAASKPKGANSVAASPQSVADTAALEAILNSSNASAAALNFYRMPLFLLPIYKAAAVQYGVPWQILAAINEIETDYGTDLSVSSAGAVGWMQFMPATWLQYGVDALDAGYADPYNPVDAIFAAARYLRAAGAATNLKAAILAYNHSEEYVELGAAAGEADHDLPARRDRDPDRPDRRPPARDRQAARLADAGGLLLHVGLVDLERHRQRHPGPRRRRTGERLGRRNRLRRSDARLHRAAHPGRRRLAALTQQAPACSSRN